MPPGKLAAALLFSTLLISNAAQAQQTAPSKRSQKRPRRSPPSQPPAMLPSISRQKSPKRKTHDPQWNADIEYWWQSPHRLAPRSPLRQLLPSPHHEQRQSLRAEHRHRLPELIRNLTVELVDTIPRFDQLAALHQQVQKIDGTPRPNTRPLEHPRHRRRHHQKHPRLHRHHPRHRPLRLRRRHRLGRSPPRSRRLPRQTNLPPHHCASQRRSNPHCHRQSPRRPQARRQTLQDQKSYALQRSTPRSRSP